MGNLDSGHLKNTNTNITKSKLQQILDYCERSFVEQVGSGFDGQLEEVLTSLKQLSQDSTSYRDKQFYNEIYFTLINARSNMSVDFKIHLKKYFKEKIKKQMDKDNNTGSAGFDSRKLSIISEVQENQFMEEKRLEKSMENTLSEELIPLNARVESLLGEKNNPFTPDIVIKAFTATIEKIIKGEQAQKQIYVTFGKVCPDQLKTTYQGLNNFLISNDVVPDVQEYVRKVQERKILESKNQVDESYGATNNYLGQSNPYGQERISMPQMPKFGAPPLNNLNVPELPSFGKMPSLGENSSSLTQGAEYQVPPMPGHQFEPQNLQNQNNRQGQSPLTMPPRYIPGFENMDSFNSSISQNNTSVPSGDDFVRMGDDDDDNSVESLRIRETDSPAQKREKWSKAKENISKRFNKVLGRVRDVTPIKEAVIGTDSPTVRPVPPGYTSIPAYQIRPNNFHRLMKETVVAQKLAEARGEQFSAFPEGITQEQIEAHRELFVNKEDSTMLNDAETLQSFVGYQLQFKKVSMNEAMTPDRDGVIAAETHRNVLAEIAEASVQNHKMDPNETMTVDLLSLVFEKIFAHPNLPVHIKFLVSKLQIPILRTSLLDKTFFIYRDNPVRLFLDCLATHETLYNLEFHEKFEVIIDDLLNSDEITQGHFSEALEKIQLMLRDYSAKENKLIAQIATPISLEEKAAENYEVILEYVKDKITKRSTYVPFISFVESVWAKSFAERWTVTTNKEGNFLANLDIAAKLSLNQGLLVFEMIIWSNEVRAKTFENREKLKGFIPKIEEGLNKMMVDLKISEDEINKLKVILNEQNEKFISDIERTKEQEAALVANEEAAIKGFMDRTEPVRKVKAAKKDIATAKSDFDMVFTAGKWFEFVHDKSKLRLVWVSPQKTIYLFNNPDKKKVYKFDKSRVWAYYRSSHIKLINNEAFGTENLIEEAVTGNQVEGRVAFSI